MTTTIKHKSEKVDSDRMYNALSSCIDYLIKNEFEVEEQLAVVFNLVSIISRNAHLDKETAMMILDESFTNNHLLMRVNLEWEDNANTNRNTAH